MLNLNPKKDLLNEGYLVLSYYITSSFIKKDTFNVSKVPLVSLYAVGVCTRKITYLHVAGMNDISQIIGAAPSVPVIDIDYLHPGFVIATLSPSAPYILAKF